MASAKEKAKDQRRKASASRMVEDHDSGGSRALKIPTGIKMLKVNKAGTRRLDFLPYECKVDHNPHADKGSLAVERTYFVHRGIGVNEDQILCAAKTLGKPCPICEKRAELNRGDGNQDQVKALRPKERQLWIVIDLDTKEKDIQIWDVSEHLFGRYIRDKIDKQDPGDNYNLFADLEDGKTLKIGVREEKGDGMTWYDCSNIEFKDRDKPYDESILEKVPDLDACLNDLGYDKASKIFLGESKPEEDEDDEDRNGTAERTETPEPEEKPRAGKAKEEKPEVPEPAKDEDDAAFKKGDVVEFEYKGEKVTGEVLEFDKANDLVRVKSDQRANPHNLEPDDLKKVERPKAGKDKEEKPAAKGEAIKVGDMVRHKKHGICEVIKIKGDDVTIEDDNNDLQKVPLADLVKK
jgi:hypothetical protein